MNRPLLENETHWRREFISLERYFETIIPGWEAFSLKLIPNGRVDCAFAARWTLDFYWCTGMNPIWRGSSLQGKTFPVTLTLRIFRFCRCIRCWTRMNPIGRGNSSLLTGTFVCTVLPNSVEWLSALGNEPHWVREFIPAMECRRCTKMKPIGRGNSFRQPKLICIDVSTFGWTFGGFDWVNSIGCGHSSRHWLSVEKLGIHYREWTPLSAGIHLVSCFSATWKSTRIEILIMFSNSFARCWPVAGNESLFVSLSRENESFDWRWNSSRTVD